MKQQFNMDEALELVNQGALPNENSLLKLLYMGIQNASKKWTMPIWNWSLRLSKLVVFF